MGWECVRQNNAVKNPFTLSDLGLDHQIRLLGVWEFKIKHHGVRHNVLNNKMFKAFYARESIKIALYSLILIKMRAFLWYTLVKIMFGLW